MKRFEVNIHWSGPIMKDSDYLLKRKVLYMFANSKEPLFIGEAGRLTVAQCWNAHRHDGLFEWVASHVNGPFSVKVGHLWNDGEGQFDLRLLHDVRTLLQFEEYRLREYCRGNRINEERRGTCRPGMVVVNHGLFKPLYKTYYDRDTSRGDMKFRPRPARSRA